MVTTVNRLASLQSECRTFKIPLNIFSVVRYLVIDEADRMMSNMADDWLNVLESAVYRKIIYRRHFDSQNVLNI